MFMCRYDAVSLFSKKTFTSMQGMKHWMALLLGLLSLGASNLAAQDLANMREDLRLLTQRVGELSMRVEDLERANGELQTKANRSTEAYATLQQLNDAVARLNAAMKAAVAESETDTLRKVSVQMEKLANQMNAALDAMAGGTPAGGFSESYPKEGISYTVQKGDILARIARKTGAKLQDIINANKISDPSKIQAGQVLFIPGGK